MLKKVAMCIFGSVILLLGGCGETTMKDLTTKAEKAKTKQQLQDALGEPQKFEKLKLPIIGTGETWTYEASDGDVTFTIYKDKIEAIATEAKKKSK